MNKADQFRRYADECRVSAQRLSFPDAKAQLLKVADAWEALAAEHGRRCTFDISPLKRVVARLWLFRGDRSKRTG